MSPLKIYKPKIKRSVKKKAASIGAGVGVGVSGIPDELPTGTSEAIAIGSMAGPPIIKKLLTDKLKKKAATLPLRAVPGIGAGILAYDLVDIASPFFSESVARKATGNKYGAKELRQYGIEELQNQLRQTRSNTQKRSKKRKGKSLFPKNRKQAIAIALSEARRKQRRS